MLPHSKTLALWRQVWRNHLSQGSVLYFELEWYSFIYTQQANQKTILKKHFTSFILLSIDNSNIIYLFTMRLLFPLQFTFYPKINVFN